MVDERSIEAQCHKLQKITRDIITKGMSLDKQSQISFIIDKMPMVWNILSFAFPQKNQLRFSLLTYNLKKNLWDKIKNKKFFLFQITKRN